MIRRSQDGPGNQPTSSEEVATYTYYQRPYPARTSTYPRRLHQVLLKSGYVDSTVHAEQKRRHKPCPKAYKNKSKQSHNSGMESCLYQQRKPSKVEMDLQRKERERWSWFRWSWFRHERGTCENFWQFPPLLETSCVT